MKFLLVLTLMSFQALSATSQKKATCLSTREYITSLEYLREHKEFSLDEKDSQMVASNVSMGCTGASKRFIQVMNLVTKAGIPSHKGIRTAQEFAMATDDVANTFIVVFKGAFIESLLDLDMAQALNIATELSLNFGGDKKLAEKNFNELVNFCMDKKSLDLPIIDCARMGVRVIRNGSDYSFNVTKDFIALFNYLTGSKENHLVTYEALSVSEEVMKHGPEAKNNFIQGYEYALSKTGLGRTQKDAVEFGKLMASRSTAAQK